VTNTERAFNCDGKHDRVSIAQGGYYVSAEK